VGPDPLSDYNAKRRFDRTPEPAGSGGTAEPAGSGGTAEPAGKVRPSPTGGRFVVQEHHATALHWDVRLEHEGTLPSWACPKGLPRHPARNHLAVRTEDHPIEYLDFEGHIPEGEYGGGSMHIWDRGTYELEEWGDRKVKVVLHGERVEGRYAFFATGGRGGRDWMVHRMDPPAQEWAPRPDDLVPVEPEAGPLPEGDGWVVEPWWPGRRVLIAVEGGRPAGPSPDVAELRQLAEGFGSTEVLLDGVLMAVGEDGKPDPAGVDRRLAAKGSAARRLAKTTPLQLVVVDLLWQDGESLVERPLAERRRRLVEDLPEGPVAALTMQVDLEQAAVLLAAGPHRGLLGVVAKRLDSTYGPDAGWVAVNP
jgi:bifunctional non-homologous end joining protein LigD